MELAGVEINRKMLSELAINNPDVFKEIVDIAKAALPPAGEAPDLSKMKKGVGDAHVRPGDKGNDAAKKTAKKPVAKKKIVKKEAKEEEKVEAKEEKKED